MNRINYIKYNPFYSYLRYLFFKLSRRITYPEQNIEKTVTLSDSREYRVFLEIDILDNKNVRKKGSAVFKIIFHSPEIPVDLIIRRTRYTIPFFSGLPGFCTKQFMVNKSDNKFSGRYEWETVEMAQKYARSYALYFMRKRSHPLPVFYEIINKENNEIVESRMIENG